MRGGVWQRGAARGRRGDQVAHKNVKYHVTPVQLSRCEAVKMDGWRRAAQCSGDMWPPMALAIAICTRVRVTGLAQCVCRCGVLGQNDLWAAGFSGSDVQAAGNDVWCVHVRE
jgi:hypothetical protein